MQGIHATHAEVKQEFADRQQKIDAIRKGKAQ
jgi:uncharacterized protein (DUF2164 family)